jgi:hypothetical protein
MAFRVVQRTTIGQWQIVGETSCTAKRVTSKKRIEAGEIRTVNAGGNPPALLFINY